MTAFLIIVGIILLIVVVICFLPITVEFSYDGKFKIYVFVAGIKVYDAFHEKIEENVSEIKDYAKKRITIKSFIQISKMLLDIINRLKLKLKITNLMLDIQYGGEDAAQTAVNYGRLNAAVYTLYGAINNFCKVEKCDIKIVPTFEVKQFAIKFKVIIYGRAGNIILALLRILVYLIVNRENINDIKHTIKDGENLK